MRNLRKYLLLLLKFGMSAGILAYLFLAYDIRAVWESLQKINEWYFIAVMLLAGVQYFLTFIRLKYACEFFFKPDVMQIFKVNWVGAFLGQVVISFVSGDLYKVWMIKRQGVALGRAGEIVLLDRITGLFAILVLTLLGAPFLASRLQDDVALGSLSFIWAGCALGIVSFLGLGLLQPPDRESTPRGVRVVLAIATLARHLYQARQRGLLLVGIGLIVNVMNVIMVWLLLVGMGETFPFSAAMAVVPPIILLSLTPISIAGWGVREKAMVVALGLFGIAGPPALAASIILGGVILLWTLPGSMIWLTVSKEMAFLDFHAETTKTVPPGQSTNAKS